MRKFIKYITVLLFAVALLGFCIIYYANHVSLTGDKVSSWIRFDMWRAKYFNSKSIDESKYDLVNLESLRPQASKNERLLGFIGSEKCAEVSEACALSKLSAANLLIDSGSADQSLGLIESARSTLVGVGACTINLESTILVYKLHKLSSMSLATAKAEARAVVEKIQSKGGLVSNLRTDSCEFLAERKPMYFHEYVRLVSRVMSYAGGDLAKGSAYIDSEDYISN